MELSLRLDTLGLVDVHYLRGRERYRDWPHFQLLAASRQARVQAYMSREVLDQLHQQILAVEEAVGLDVEDQEDDEDEDDLFDEGEDLVDETAEGRAARGAASTERETNSAFSPSLAQALDRLNELARQRLPDASAGTTEHNELLAESGELVGDEEDALVQLQDAFIQMMDVVRELAEELATDALKVMGRLRCARTNIIFTQAELSALDEEDEAEELAETEAEESDMMELEVELVMVLQLYEEGRSRPEDPPAVELQLDVENFERLHETLDQALQREERSRRRSADPTNERGRRSRRRP